MIYSWCENLIWVKKITIYSLLVCLLLVLFFAVWSELKDCWLIMVVIIESSLKCWLMLLVVWISPAKNAVWSAYSEPTYVRMCADWRSVPHTDILCFMVVKLLHIYISIYMFVYELLVVSCDHICVG